MIKLYTRIATCLLLLTGTAKAQVLFSENFNNISGPTAGGAGTYSFPNGWFLRNVDNNTPNAAVSYVNDAWIRREDFNFNPNDSAAFSTSWYSTAGTSDDWMWTPLINSITSVTYLTWRGVAYDPSFPDGYEVRIMTGTDGPPTGGTGAIGNQITNSTVVFSTTAEAGAWTSHSVSLAAYAGQSVYIGFRNNTTDEFLLAIDDIVVQNLNNYDASVSAPDTVSQYTEVPITQSPDMNFGATITNNGSLALTNVRLKIDVLNSLGTNVYSGTSSPLGSLASLSSAHFTVAPFTPTAIDAYSVRYVTLVNEADQVPSNDSITLNNVLIISDTTYARDNANVSGSLGIGAGNGGYLGQQFDILNQDTLTSVSGYFTRGYTGRNLGFAIWNMSAGKPSAIIGVTDTLIYPDDSARFYTIPVSGQYLALSPGVYTVTAIEFDSTLAIGLADGIFTSTTTWVNWPTTPFSGWASNEAFGGAFSKPYVIRPNFGTVNHVLTGITEMSNGNLILYPNPARNELFLSFRNGTAKDMSIQIFDDLGKVVSTIKQDNNDGLNKRIDTSGFANGLYTVVVHSGNQIMQSKVAILK